MCVSVVNNGHNWFSSPQVSLQAQGLTRPEGLMALVLDTRREIQYPLRSVRYNQHLPYIYIIYIYIFVNIYYSNTSISRTHEIYQLITTSSYRSYSM